MMPYIGGDKYKFYKVETVDIYKHIQVLNPVQLTLR